MKIVYFFIFILFLGGCSKATLTEELLIKSGYYRDKQDYKNQVRTFEEMIKVIESDSYSDSINIMYSHGFSSMQFVYLKIGDLFFNLNRYDKALLYFQKAKDVILNSEFPSNVGIGTSNSRIAKVYIEIGQQEKAIKILKENIKVSSLAPIFQLDTYMLLKNIYINQKNFTELRNIANKLTLLKSNFLTQTALTCDIDIHLGEIYKYLKDFHQAKWFYQNCLTIASQQDDKYYTINRASYRLYALSGRNYLDLVTPNFMLGVLYMDEKKYNQANKYFNEAINTMNIQKFIPKSNYAQILLYQSILERERKNYRLSLSLLKQSIEAKRNISGENSLMDKYWAMSNLYEILHDNKNSYKYMQKSYDIFLKNRHNNFTVLTNSERVNYLKMKETLLLNLLDITFNYQKELLVKEKSKLFKTTLTDWLNYKGSISDTENMIRTLKNQTTDSDTIEQITKFEEAQKAYASFVQNGQKKEIIEKKKSEIDEIFKWLALKVNKFQEENELQSINYHDIAKYLKKNELYIDYARAGDNYYLFSLDLQENVSFVKLEKQFLPLIQAFRNEVRTIADKKLVNYPMNQNSKDRLSKLYKLLLEPIKEQLSAKKSLIISTDGALRLLPFETLYNQQNQHYLIEEKEIRYIPSGKEFVRLHKYTKKESTSSNKIVIFANPNDTNTNNSNQNRKVPKFFKRFNLSALKGAEEEAKEIKRLFGNVVSIFSKKFATEAKLLEVKQPKILHIATHGFFNNDKKIQNPMLKSGLVLSEARLSRQNGTLNGFTTALKLSELDLKGTELVVLSACDTGMVDIDATDSISGLGKAFIQAGAKNVVMSLWSVNDTMTKELMINFYQNIKNGLSYSHAMTEAKLKMIKKGLHPFYWGGFVLSGL